MVKSSNAGWSRWTRSRGDDDDDEEEEERVGDHRPASHSRPGPSSSSTLPTNFSSSSSSSASPVVGGSQHHHHHRPTPPGLWAKLSSLPGGKKSLLTFLVSLVSYTLQTEAAQYVQQGLGYRKPFLSLYLGHSGFIVLLPVHLLALSWKTGRPISHYTHLLAQNLHWQLGTPVRRLEGEVQDQIGKRLTMAGGRKSGVWDREEGEYDQRQSSERGGQGHRQGHAQHGDARQVVFAATEEGEQDDVPSSSPLPISRPMRPPLANSRPSWRNSYVSSGPAPIYTGYFEENYGFNVPKLILLLLVLMVGITVPALSWYCAVPMTSMADITALYNTFSVWALVFSVWFLGEKWNRYKVISVLMACGGVVIVAYGGAEHRRKPKELDPIYGKPPAADTTTQIAATTTAMTTSEAATDSMLPTTTPVVDREADRRTVDAVVAELIARRSESSLDSLIYEPRQSNDSNTPPPGATSAYNPFLGDLLALFGAVTMAAYEMAFKLLGTLPDEERQKRRWDEVRSGNARRSRFIDGEENGHSVLGKDAEVREEDEAEGLLNAEGDSRRREDTLEEGDVTNELDGPRLPHERSAIWSKTKGKMSRSSSHGEQTDGVHGLSLPDSLGSANMDSYGSGDVSPHRQDWSEVAAADTRARNDKVNISKQRSSRFDDDNDVEEDEDEDAASLASASTEQESTLDDLDAEEILAGSTRLSRGRSWNQDKRKGRGGGAKARGALPSWTDDPSRDDATGDVGRPHSHGPHSSGRHATSDDGNEWIPPPLPFGLHANLITSGIGLVTFSTLWLGLVLAHLTGWETFSLPHNFTTLFFLFFVVGTGILFNMTFMQLLSLWGPVTASVSCLLSTVAVAAFDALLRGQASLLSIAGCALIVGGFFVLVLNT